jgi:hypothetical protein
MPHHNPPQRVPRWRTIDASGVQELTGQRSRCGADRRGYRLISSWGLESGDEVLPGLDAVMTAVAPVAEQLASDGQVEVTGMMWCCQPPSGGEHGGHPEARGLSDMIKAPEPQVRTVAEGEEIFPRCPRQVHPGATAQGTPPASSTRAGSGRSPSATPSTPPSRSPTRSGKTHSTTTANSPPASAAASSRSCPSPTPSDLASTSPTWSSAASTSTAACRPSAPSTRELRACFGTRDERFPGTCCGAWRDEISVV